MRRIAPSPADLVGRAGAGGGGPRVYIDGASLFALRCVALVVALWTGFGGAAVGQEPTGDTAAFEALGLDSPKVLEEPAGPPVEGAELDRRTERVAGLMRCPVCQGLSIADSPVDSAQAMKREVRKLLAAGYSDEQVLSYFERSYGEFIRLSPKPTGFNLVVWAAPILAILAGALLVAARIRSSRPALEPAAAAGDPELEDYLERVRKEAGS